MGAFLAYGGACLAFGLFCIAIYEGYALSTGKVPPITTIVRNKIAQNPHRAVIWFSFFSLLAGWLIGHLGR